MLLELSTIFPCDDIEKTCDYYVKILGFRAVKYLEVEQPHICLYKDKIEIILTKTCKESFVPNHIRYGYGYDAYFYTQDQEILEEECLNAGIKLVKRLNITDYNNKEFVIEDCDGRYIAFGCK